MRNKRISSQPIDRQLTSKLLLAGAALLLLLALSPSVVAKPDCVANPTHPSCSDHGGGGGGGDLEAWTENTGFCASANAELYADTRDFGDPDDGVTGYQHCKNTTTGSSVPDTNRELFTDFQQCMLDMDLPGVPVTGSTITMNKASFNSKRNKRDGNIFAVHLFFEDVNGAKYESDIIDVSTQTPYAQGYTLVIEATADIFPQGKKRNRVAVGTVCVDQVIYEPL